MSTHQETESIVLPHVLLVRSGVSTLDLQGRISGRLDVPLAPEGEFHVAQLAAELAGQPVAAVVSSTAMTSVQTAEVLARQWKVRVRALPELANVDFGLWHGRCVEELQQTQPRLLKCLEESPELVCPPKGEPIVEARKRVRAVLAGLGSKYGNRLVAITVPGPIAAIIRSLYQGRTDFDETGMSLWWDAVGHESWFEFSSRQHALA
jgi:phosphoserine phosphatase